MKEKSNPRVEITVHEGADPRIERILDLIDEAARPRPLVEVLGVLCSEVAAIVDAQVASIYVRDDPPEENTLVLRANVGFPGTAIGKVRLQVGEGITGFAAECMRPVTVSVAEDDAHYKAVPGLGEEEFPIFLALPILVGRRAEAVVVLQRRVGRPFTTEEIVLSTALATVFAYTLERARDRREESEEAPRKAHLRGFGKTGGSALGRVETLPTFEGLAALARARGRIEEERSARIDACERALEQIARDHRKTLNRLRDDLDPRVVAKLESLFLLFGDQRFVASVDTACLDEVNPAFALREVARVYTRAPYATGAADESSKERSTEVEALCLQVAARVVDERIPREGSALLSPEGLSALVVLGAIAHRVSCIAVGGPLSEDHPSVQLARAAGMPLVTSVGGLFAWTREGDRLLLNADSGLLEVNPSAARLAQYRAEQPEEGA